MFEFTSASGFIFDCDGTLIDALDAWEQAEAALFAQTGPLSQEQEDEIHSAPIEEAAAIFHERYGVMGSSQEVLQHLDGHLIPFYSEQAYPIDGACEFVLEAHRRGIPCVVVSSSPRRYLEAGLKRAGILDKFCALISTDEAGCSKKDSLIYDKALAALGSSVSSTWAVDDAPYAVAAMHDFGLKTICIGARMSPVADINVGTFRDLLS